MSPKEILQNAVQEVHYTKGVRYSDIIKTLEGIIKELKEIQE